MRSGRVVVVLLALVLLLPAGAATKQQADWPQFQFDAARTGYNKFEKVLNKDNIKNLTKAWDYAIVECEDWPEEPAYFDASPVAQGRIYVHSSYGGIPTFTALDAATGEMLWPYPNLGENYIRQVLSAPAMDKDRLYVVALWGDLLALDADTGYKLWEQYIRASFYSGEFLSSPAVAKGVV